MNGLANGLNGAHPARVHENGMNGKKNGNGHVQVDPRGFLCRVVNLLLKEGVINGTDVNSKVVEFRHPEKLQQTMDFQLKPRGEPDDKLLQLCSETIAYSVKTGHPHFFNQLFAGFDEYGLAGSWLSETLNTSQYTFEVAPVFTLMESTVLRKMAALIGYETSDGIFCPGGSISNMYGLNIARYHQFPQIKVEGMHALPRLCLFTSEHSHYSVKKGAALLGIGISNVRVVRCDSAGRMDVTALEQDILAAKDQGFHPYLVNATAGTTVAGAYDPLEDVAAVCARHGLWLHVDACWGGGALMSAAHRSLLTGIHRADSVAWNPHKMMGTPLQCCAFITKHEKLLQKCHCANAQYLFQQDKFYDVSYDTGDKSIQCGRKVDVFKLWLTWKAKGDAGFEKDIDNLFSGARYLVDQLHKTEGFETVFAETQCTNVCFWYIPPRMRKVARDDAWWTELGTIAPKIKERMVLAGTMLIGYQPLGNKVNFFRMVVSNLKVTHEDMDFLVTEIDRLGHDL